MAGIIYLRILNRGPSFAFEPHWIPLRASAGDILARRDTLVSATARCLALYFDYVCGGWL